MRTIFTLVGLLGLVALCVSKRVDAVTSGWVGRAGMHNAYNRTQLTMPVILTNPNTGLQYARSWFRLINPDGTIYAEPYTNSTFAQRLKVQCFPTSARTGGSQTVEVGWSTEEDEHTLRAYCPQDWGFAAFYRTELNIDPGPYYFEGSNCTSGALWVVTSGQIMSQLTGAAPDPYLGVPLTNNTYNQARVGGTDVGNIYYYGPSSPATLGLQLAFGDTYTSKGCGGTCTGFRGNTLAHTFDYDPVDGITIDHWTTGTSTYCSESICAAQIIPKLSSEETGPIPTGGFSISEQQGTWNHYRYLPYFKPTDWHPMLVSAGSSIAYSLNNGAWQRGDQVSGFPEWPAGSNFGAVATYYHRRVGNIYLFGTEAEMPYNPTGVRLAKVKAEHAKISDPTRYWYWSGSGWVRDVNGDYAEAMPGWNAPAADVIPTSAHARGDMSIIYNHYARRYMMMFLNTESARMELWQSEALQGPWSRVSSSNSPGIFGTTSPGVEQGAGPYAPLMTHYWLEQGGSEIWFLVSHFLPIYNVALWRIQIAATPMSDCNL